MVLDIYKKTPTLIDMKIIVNNAYSYETGRHIVKKGDRVILSTPSWLLDVKPPTWEGTVTATKSDYDGHCDTILGVAKKS